jgi:hypothetical protein
VIELPPSVTVTTTGRMPAKSTTERPSALIVIVNPPPPVAVACGVFTVYPSERQAPMTHGAAPRPGDPAARPVDAAVPDADPADRGVVAYRQAASWR